MQLAQAVRVGAWLLIGLNLLMALGAIWILMRMAPAMAGIIERNDRSLYACEEMLAALVLVGDDMAPEEEEHLRRFEVALKQAQENVTEKGESAVLKLIAANSSTVFAGNLSARRQMVSAIGQLGDINREAMNQADKRVRQFGEAGIWGVVFMAISVFGVGLLFTRSLLRRVVTPMVELHAVISAYRNGETRRRCSGVDMSPEVRSVFHGINEILDQGQAQDLLKRDLTGNWRQDQADVEK